MQPHFCRPLARLTRSGLGVINTASTLISCEPAGPGSHFPEAARLQPMPAAETQSRPGASSG